MNNRHPGVPIFVFTDANTGGRRCINGLHVQTFIATPFGDAVGTLITFASGGTVTVAEDFDTVADAFMGDRQDG